MSGLKSSTHLRTICEVLREMNDLVQENNDKDIKIRELIVEAFGMGKRMAKKLYEYNKIADADWWEKNPECNRRIKEELRRGLNYKIGK